MSDALYQGAALILPLIMAIVFHEVAHGYVARLLGDPTADELGRLTLNPLRHVDPVGTVVLPGMLALAHMPVFGWAKPVPVVPQRLRNPRRDMMLVALAGPGSNLVLAALGAVVLGLLVRQANGVQAGPVANVHDANLNVAQTYSVIMMQGDRRKGDERNQQDRRHGNKGPQSGGGDGTRLKSLTS